MKKIFNIIRFNLLNGLYSYALFGFYSLTVSPFVTRFFKYEDKNLFITLFGFTMLIAESFALNFKLKMVRIRTEEKRIAYKNETGIDIIPRPSPLVLFGFFMRLAFQIVIIMVSMTALGYSCTETEMSPQGLIALLLGLFTGLCGLIYMYFSSGFYTDPATSKREWIEELKKADEWDKSNLPRASSAKYYWEEVISDIILQVYALMLFTAFWKYINQTGIDILHNSILNNESTGTAATELFAMLFFMTVMGLMPMRIAYWIEDSMMAFTKKEKIGMWIIFFFAALFSCSPAIIQFINLYFFQTPHDLFPTEYLNLILTMLFILIIVLTQIILSRISIQKGKLDTDTNNKKGWLFNASP